MLRFGIDLGGTKTEGAILDGDGCERFRERVATDATSYPAVLAGIVSPETGNPLDDPLDPVAAAHHLFAHAHRPCPP